MEDIQIQIYTDPKYQILNPFILFPLKINTENITYPSIMLYIYDNLLCPKYKQKLILGFNIIDKSNELHSTFQELFQKCELNITTKALALAYKMKISQFRNCQHDLAIIDENTTDLKNLLDKKQFSQILDQIKAHLSIIDKKKLDQDLIFKIYKVYITLNYLLSQGYDIKELIGDNIGQILKRMDVKNETDPIFLRDNPLWAEKLKLFKNFYNKIPSAWEDKELIIKEYELLNTNNWRQAAFALIATLPDPDLKGHAPILISLMENDLLNQREFYYLIKTYENLEQLPQLKHSHNFSLTEKEDLALKLRQLVGNNIDTKIFTDIKNELKYPGNLVEIIRKQRIQPSSIFIFKFNKIFRK